MRITVRLFAGHRERAGTSQVELDVPDGVSVSDAFAILVEKYPPLADTDSFTTMARNRQVVERSTMLSDGDELALLQPVSGGATGRIGRQRR